MPNGGLPTTKMILGRDPKKPAPTFHVTLQYEGGLYQEKWRPVVSQSTGLRVNRADRNTLR